MSNPPTDRRASPLGPEMMSAAERLEEAASLLGRNSPLEDERVRGHRVLLSPDTLGLLPVCNGPEESARVPLTNPPAGKPTGAYFARRGRATQPKPGRDDP